MTDPQSGLTSLYCRLPLYLLLPTSACFFLMDWMLYASAGGDEAISMDATVRFGMSGGFGIVILAFFIGSLALLAAAVVFLVESWKRKSFDLSCFAFIGLGFLFHPWVVGAVYDRLLA